MQEQNPTNPPQPQKQAPPEVPQWQWQSDSGPHKEKDPSKWTWQNYPSDISLIIEKAFSHNKEEIIELGDFELNLRSMLLVHKKQRNQVFRVRRQTQSRFLMEIPQPAMIIAKEQKTMNEAFGTIQHFLDYIMKRTPEAYGLYQRLKRLPLDCKENQFRDIIQEVIGCVEKGAKAREKVGNLQGKSFTSEAKVIVDLIKRSLGSLKEFLGTILKAYTMETFICYWLNELLRSENWEEINVLTPYLVCLVYTFKLKDYIMKYEEPKGLLNSFLGFVGKQGLSLYRGAALTKEHLAYYNPVKVRYFSWNGVTSTSRNKNVALNFIRLSLNKSIVEQGKVGVMFVIETDVGSVEDCEGMIDISRNSQYPDEQEIILAPGTVFELLKITERAGYYQICLKIKKKFEKTKENIALLGALQDQSILGERAVIDGLPSEKSFRLLELLKGNKLIRKIEIRNSGIQDHIMEEIEGMRVTTTVKKCDVKLVGNTISVGSLSGLVEYFSWRNLNEICLANRVMWKESGESDDGRIERLILKERVLEKFRQNGGGEGLKRLYEKVKNERRIRILKLSMKYLQEEQSEELRNLVRELRGLVSLDLRFDENFSNEGISHLKIALKELNSLKHLSLDLNKCMDISDEGLKDLLISAKSLQKLSLGFQQCWNISDVGLKYLEKSSLSMANLQRLSLDFQQCWKISDHGLGFLTDALKNLTCLQLLSLHFSSCDKITDEGFKHLKNSLMNLTGLKYLSLDFGWCKNISDLGLGHLKTGLLSCKFLEHLSLNFRGYNLISNEGLNHLKNGLRNLTCLQYLALDFGCCKEISDEGLGHLRDGLTPWISLQHLSIDLKDCNRISDLGLRYLAHALGLLIDLKYLSLDFGWCKQISDIGLSDLKNALISLKFLQHLSLDFTDSKEISDEGISHIKNSLSTLTDLKHLSLCFRGCNKITNLGLSHLKDALLTLRSLRNLALNFKQCNNISNEGLNSLKNGLKTLVFLKSLSLNLRKCDLISNEGVHNLKTAMIFLPSLHGLSLNFRGCNKISNEGLNHLKNALLPLTDLQELSLNFKQCVWISDEGIFHLKNALAALTSLQELSIGLRECNKITDEGLDHLKSAFVAPGALQHFSLDLVGCESISDEAVYLMKNSFVKSILEFECKR